MNIKSLLLYGRDLMLRGKDEQRDFRWSDLHNEVDDDGYPRLRYTFPTDAKTTGVGVGKCKEVEDAPMYANSLRPDECPLNHYRDLELCRPEGARSLLVFYYILLLLFVRLPLRDNVHISDLRDNVHILCS